MWITDTTAAAAAVCDGGVARGHEENHGQHCCCLKLYFISRGSDTGRSWLHPRLTQLARQPPKLGRALIPVLRAFGADAIWSDAVPWA
jgi:hypothetical protein